MDFKLPKVKGSTVIISVMYVSVVVYAALDIWVYSKYKVWLPDGLTAFVGACFVVETASLAALKMAKERGSTETTKQRTGNSFMSRLGVSGLPDFSAEETAAAQEAAKEEKGGNQ